jgi:hypothetical protein
MSDTNMTFSDWIDSLTDDERETLCAYDAWKEGARQMLNALVERGYIDEMARNEISADKPLDSAEDYEKRA